MATRDEMFKNLILADEFQNKNSMRVFELPEEVLTFKSGMNPREHCCYQPKDLVKFKEIAMNEIEKEKPESRVIRKEIKSQTMEKEMER
jgi:hypothetical protein